MPAEFWWKTSCKLATWKTIMIWEDNINTGVTEVGCENERLMELAEVSCDLTLQGTNNF